MDATIELKLLANVSNSSVLSNFNENRHSVQLSDSIHFPSSRCHSSYIEVDSKNSHR